MVFGNHPSLVPRCFALSDDPRFDFDCMHCHQVVCFVDCACGVVFPGLHFVFPCVVVFTYAAEGVKEWRCYCSARELLSAFQRLLRSCQLLLVARESRPHAFDTMFKFRLVGFLKEMN